MREVESKPLSELEWQQQHTDPSGGASFMDVAGQGASQRLPLRKTLHICKFLKHFLSHCLMALCDSPVREAWAGGGGRVSLPSEERKFWTHQPP